MNYGCQVKDSPVHHYRSVASETTNWFHVFTLESMISHALRVVYPRMPAGET